MKMAALFITVLLVVPQSLFAQSTTDLQAQIADLLARIQQLQQQLGTSQTGGGGTPVIPAGGSPVGAGGSYLPSSGGPVLCPHIGRNLKRGASGDDVARLQRYLAVDPLIYPEALVTGYFGPATEAAVRRWQTKHFIVSSGTPETTGYGMVGPRTAAILALQCPGETYAGGGGNVSGFIKVTPISGNAPLTVSVEATVNTTKSCSGSSYEIDFGDGTPPVAVNVPQQACAEVRQVFNHVYNAPGTYQVTLRSGIHRTAATVVVGGTAVPAGQDTLTISPTSGTAPLTVNFSGVVNAARACSSAPYSISFGDGAQADIPYNTSACASFAYNVTHTYTGNGVFSVNLKRAGATIASASVSVGVSVSQGLFSVTAGIDSSNPLKVRVRFEIASSCSAYELDWGDASGLVSQSEGSCSSSVFTKEFTHTYPSSGSYTVTLRRGSTLSSTDTAGITINE